MENDKRIILNSSVQNIVIENKLARFQNSLFSNSYLHPDKNYAITPRQIYMDLNFKNPICPVDNSFPSFICVPLKHLISKAGENLDNLNLDHFYNVHKYYLNTAKKYSIKDLYDEWKSKEIIALKVKKKYKKQLEKVAYELPEGAELYPDKDLHITTTCLKKMNDSILFGQHAIALDYEIQEAEKTILFFHHQFAEKLDIARQFIDIKNINNEKYFMFMPLDTSGMKYLGGTYLKDTIGVSMDNQGLLFKTPNILQIKCENIKAYPHDSNFTKTIGVVKLNSENKYSSFCHTFKGNQFYPLENKLNETWEILITDENNSRLKLYEGIPTILEISVIETKMENELNIACTSKVSDIYPKNSPTEFTSLQAQPIEITHEWQVALSSITFKNHFKFDSNFHFKFSYQCYNRDLEKIFERSVTIDEDVKSITDIYTIFKDVLKRHIDPDRKKRSSNTHRASIGKVVIQDGSLSIYFYKATRIKFSPHLAMILGVNKNHFDSNTDPKVESVEYEIGMERNSNDAATGGTLVGVIPIDMEFNLAPKFMFIEMDAIKDVPIGNQNGKILKIVPLSKESSGRYVTEEFKILDFHPLERHCLRKIDFRLRAQSGSLLQAHDTIDFNTTWVQLIFRKFPKNRKRNYDNSFP